MAALDASRDIKEAEDAAQMLSDAINSRDKDEASKYLDQLLDLKLPVCVKINPEAYSKDNIRLRVGVADAVSDAHIPITVIVPVYMTISELKEKINRDYGFHPALQRWVIGKRLAQDRETLYHYGVRNHDDTAFLFILSTQAANLSREQERKEKEDRRIDDIIEVIDRPPQRPPELIARGANPPPLPPKPQPVGWSCPGCTFVNKPTRPGCEMCSTARPENYEVPDIYQPDETETRRLQQEELASLQYEQSMKDERERNFQELLETDSHSLVGNVEELDCAICFCTIMPGEGAVLRECLHSFCRECLKETVLNCTDAEVACPYRDNAYSCNCKLQDREIRSLLSQDEYQKFLELRLNIAESRSENSYHCKTPDCAGWCIFEDDVNEFTCDICNETNCLLCKAIHKGMNCKEYQDDLRIRAQNDDAALQTTQMTNQLLKNGEAMNCPKCQVIVQKKDGCDWICCLMCKTEICWVTKQARWGPQGAGDTSGGCKCRVNGVLCHPRCQNCH
ncbi:ranBP-type and C3HC4-type zinc finger-containing protein 1-like [Cyprinus carpio]|uniref:RanBP-type and C3HC4-type zinc finger-containing protein 1 n=1 Tax=Cyprinus carpio TaxID=7962 RepID=A0A9Q9ZN97_CYPCA|nr:ranBP-type and C3HC4-type zinc finger-containing protein 1-like [Cyprinus carpio]XP_042567641.1 ranBP-type and C3HC4-type zinc finger-containing protein 1-like [Cyprinus carpio]